MSAVFKREFRSYFQNLQGYLILALMLLVEGVCFFLFNLFEQQPTPEVTLQYLAISLILIAPLLCMRCITKERHNQLLSSLPLSAAEIVLGKYFALLGVFALPAPLFFLYALILLPFGSVNLVSMLICLVAFLLLGAALISLCMFLSSLTDNSIIAAVLGVVSLLLLYFISMLGALLPASPLLSFILVILFCLTAGGIVFALTRHLAASMLIAACGVLPASLCYFFQSSMFDDLIPELLSYLSPFTWFDTFWYVGIFDIRAIVYLLSMSVFFVFLTVLRFGKYRRNSHDAKAKKGLV